MLVFFSRPLFYLTSCSDLASIQQTLDRFLLEPKAISCETLQPSGSGGLLGIWPVQCAMASISGASLTRIFPAGDERPGSVNQAIVESSYRTTHSSAQRFQRSCSANEIKKEMLEINNFVFIKIFAWKNKNNFSDLHVPLSGNRCFAHKSPYSMANINLISILNGFCGQTKSMNK